LFTKQLKLFARVYFLKHTKFNQKNVYITNIQPMKSRIAKLIKAEHLSSSKFAESIGVQRSNISHILSGRNKPSLEFIQKILAIYKNINSDWLIFGKGNMYKEGMSEKDSTNHIESLFKEKEREKVKERGRIKVEIDDDDEVEEKVIPHKERHEPKHEQPLPIVNIATDMAQKKVERIVLFFSDKTFKEYKIIE